MRFGGFTIASLSKYQKGMLLWDSKKSCGLCCKPVQKRWVRLRNKWEDIIVLAEIWGVLCVLQIQVGYRNSGSVESGLVILWLHIVCEFSCLTTETTDTGSNLCMVVVQWFFLLLLTPKLTSCGCLTFMFETTNKVLNSTALYCYIWSTTSWNEMRWCTSSDSPVSFLWPLVSNAE